MQILNEQDRFKCQPGPFVIPTRWWILILIFIAFLLPGALILVVLMAWIFAECFLIYVAVRQFIPIRK